MAAMPDLIFTVLFFFMIVTHMRVVKPMVQTQIPQGTEVEKPVKKRGVLYLFIGKPVDAQGLPTNQATHIQLNDRFVDISHLEHEIDVERALLSEDERQHMVVSIHADRDTEMGLINDVKQALRRAGALNISYSASSRKPQEKLPVRP